MGRRILDRTGQRFGKLLVRRLLRVDSAPNGALWEVRCDCGITRPVYSNRLVRSKSCGCLMREYRSRQKTGYALKHGHSATKDRKASNLYIIWQDMLRRCDTPKDPSYARYGGRGIQVCPEWRGDFRVFLRDIGPRPSPSHTVDRRDNNGNYEPSNCHWATRRQQALNRSTTIQLTYDGTTRPLQEWANLTGIRPRTIQHRLQAGWPIKEAIFHPLVVRPSRKAPHVDRSIS